MQRGGAVAPAVARRSGLEQGVPDRLSGIVAVDKAPGFVAGTVTPEVEVQRAPAPVGRLLVELTVQVEEAGRSRLGCAGKERVPGGRGYRGRLPWAFDPQPASDEGTVRRPGRPIEVRVPAGGEPAGPPPEERSFEGGLRRGARQGDASPHAGLSARPCREGKGAPGRRFEIGRRHAVVEPCRLQGALVERVEEAEEVALVVDRDAVEQHLKAVAPAAAHAEPLHEGGRKGDRRQRLERPEEAAFPERRGEARLQEVLPARVHLGVEHRSGHDRLRAVGRLRKEPDRQLVRETADVHPDVLRPIAYVRDREIERVPAARVDGKGEGAGFVGGDPAQPTFLHPRDRGPGQPRARLVVEHLAGQGHHLLRCVRGRPFGDEDLLPGRVDPEGQAERAERPVEGGQHLRCVCFKGDPLAGHERLAVKKPVAGTLLDVGDHLPDRSLPVGVPALSVGAGRCGKQQEGEKGRP